MTLGFRGDSNTMLCPVNLWIFVSMELVNVFFQTDDSNENRDGPTERRLPGSVLKHIFQPLSWEKTSSCLSSQRDLIGYSEKAGAIEGSTRGEEWETEVNNACFSACCPKPSLARWSNLPSAGNNIRHTTLDNKGALNNWHDLQHCSSILKLKIVPANAKLAVTPSVKMRCLLKDRSQPFWSPHPNFLPALYFSISNPFQLELTVSKFPWDLQTVFSSLTGVAVLHKISKVQVVDDL